MFAAPPIAIHHDHSQSALDQRLFPPNVHFVKQWIRTGWGSMTVVDAQLSAIRLLYQVADPDWFIPLSSADYPIQTAEQILLDLNRSDIDAFFDLQPIRDLGQRYINEGLGELSFKHPRYSQGAFNRYVAIPLISPKLARKIKQPNEAWVWKSRFLIKHLTPFDGTLQCYGGDFWFTASRRVAKFLLEETDSWRTLHRHFRTRGIPEESFYHTLLGNSPDFRLCPDNCRYTDWRGCYAHPRTLNRADLPRLIESTHHFARKFAFDPEFSREIDAAVAAKEARNVQRFPMPRHDTTSVTKESHRIAGQRAKQPSLVGRSQAGAFVDQSSSAYLGVAARQGANA